jgi:small redox-active disulfide protein 2
MDGETMKRIQVLGTGCAKCRTLLANVEEAVKAAGIDAHVEKVEKIAEIMKFPVMVTPALVIDGKVRSAGKVPDVAAIQKMLAGEAP